MFALAKDMKAFKSLYGKVIKPVTPLCPVWPCTSMRRPLSHAVIILIGHKGTRDPSRAGRQEGKDPVSYGNVMERPQCLKLIMARWSHANCVKSKAWSQ